MLRLHAAKVHGSFVSIPESVDSMVVNARVDPYGGAVLECIHENIMHSKDLGI